ncbi:MAG: response regulator [Holophagaceae bacterium]|nr:response regulator [Holophagaceae bacterium]
MVDSTEALQDITSPQDKKTLLLAEDDQATQALFRAGLRSLSDYKVIIVNNGLEAHSVLKKQPVDVIVTDLHMPEMDGFQLISIVYEHYPHIPVIVMTGLAETSHQNAPLFLGAIDIIPKPVKIPLLIGQVREVGNRKPDGVIKGIPLNSLLQLMAWERKNCSLTVRSEHGLGMLYLQEGELIHAIFKESEGLDAVYKILALAKVQIEFTEVCRVNRTIAIPLTELLLNAAMNSDLEKSGSGS